MVLGFYSCWSSYQVLVFKENISTKSCNAWLGSFCIRFYLVEGEKIMGVRSMIRRTSTMQRLHIFMVNYLPYEDNEQSYATTANFISQSNRLSRRSFEDSVFFLTQLIYRNTEILTNDQYC